MRWRAVRPPRAVGLAGVFSGPEWRGLSLGLVLLSTLGLLDILLGGGAALTGSLLVAPLVAAFTGGLWATIAISLLALGVTALSGLWNMNFGETDYYVQLVVFLIGGGLAVFGAKARTDAAISMRRFELLNDVAGFADGSLRLSETIERVTEVIVPELADFCMVDVIAEGGVTRAAVRADGDRDRFEEWLSRREPSLPEHLLSDADPLSLEPVYRPRVPDEVLRELAHDADDLERLRELEPRSSIVVPLVARRERLGALTLVTAWSKRRYTRDDVRFARVLAGRVALAFDNAGLFSDLQSVQRRMDTVMEILDEAVVVQDATGRLVYANQAAAELFDTESGEALISQPLERIRETYDIYREDGTPMPAEDFPPVRALQGEEPKAEIIRTIQRQTGRETWIQTRTRAIGSPGGPPLYVVTTAADLTEIKRAEFAQAMLARTGELLTSSIDYRETLRRVVRLAVPQLADWCGVGLVDLEGELTYVDVVYGRDPEKAELVKGILETTRDEPRASAARRAIATGEPRMSAKPDELFAAISADEDERAILRSLGMGSVMMVPMPAGQEAIVTLALVNDSDRLPFDEFDFAIVKQMAARAGVAIENARLATERSEIAERLQHGLLPPQLPEMPGWSAAAFYRPAGDENRVGGDFYDAFQFEGGWMLVVGDVTGRGAGAAALTALARYTIRAVGMLTGDPLRALSLLNGLLAERDETSLCSAAIVALRGDPADAVELVVAGHPPPLLVAGDSVQEVATQGPLLGAFEDPAWESTELELSQGEYLLMYTDGVTEARGETERFGETRLRTGLAGVSSPAAAVASVERSLDRFCGGSFEDDAAVLAVMRDEGVPLEAGGKAATAGVGR